MYERAFEKVNFKPVRVSSWERKAMKKKRVRKCRWRQGIEPSCEGVNKKMKRGEK